MTNLDQPPRPNLSFATAKGRHALVGLTLDEALSRVRGYSVDVLNVGDRVPRFSAKRIALVVSRGDVVEGVG